MWLNLVLPSLKNKDFLLVRTARRFSLPPSVIWQKTICYLFKEGLLRPSACQAFKSLDSNSQICEIAVNKRVLENVQSVLAVRLRLTVGLKRGTSNQTQFLARLQ